MSCRVHDYRFLIWCIHTCCIHTHTHCIQVLARQSEGMGMGSTGWMMSVAMEMSQPCLSAPTED